MKLLLLIGPEPGCLREACEPMRARLLDLGFDCQMHVEPRRFPLRLPQADVVVLHYTPFTLGLKGLNLLFCWRLRHLIRGRRLWVMFHEVQRQFNVHHRPQEWLQALIHRWMKRTLLARADEVLLSTSSWAALLRGTTAEQRPAWVVPSYSQVATVARVEEVWRLRAPAGEGMLVGHFGTRHHSTAALVREISARLLAGDRTLHMLFMGRGAKLFQAELSERDPQWKGRIQALDDAGAEEVAAGIAACDVMLQPYGDGVNCRRGTLSASLALGAAVVSNAGLLSEEFWTREDLLFLAPEPSVEALVEACRTALSSPERRREKGRRAGQFYQRWMSLDSAVKTYETLIARSGRTVEATRA